ncbi:MAG: hypothetical protein K2G45_04770 [Lachnospiraceae bacterium]|nr:hypothetical protein [Lachnospiraceae bacterium]
MRNNNNRKPKTKGGYMLAAIGWLLMALLFACALVFGLQSGFKYVIHGATSYEDMVAEHGGLQKGEYVSIDANAVIDWYAETTYKINGIIPAGSKQHCLLWIDDSTFVSLTVKGDKNRAKINALIDGTYAYLNYETDELPAPIRFEGEITSIGTEVSKYYDDILNKWQISGDEDLTVYYLTIDTTSTKLSIIGIGLFALLMVGVFIALFISRIKGFVNFGKTNTQFVSGQAGVGAAQPMANDSVFGNMYNAQNTYAGNTNMNNMYGQNDYTGNTDTNNMYTQNTYNQSTNADNTYAQNTYEQNTYTDTTNSVAMEDDDERTVLISNVSMGYTEETEKDM